ncbi:MAG: hypothetical protein K8S56_07070, partial [Candidatus Cloacimonetes bacterium]|nr:hypothetical protein [Candidatus Cloacimonadota bacterium]
MKYVFIVAFLLLTIFVSARIIDETEIQLIEMMLQQEDLTLEALKFDKDWSGDTELKLPVVIEVLNNPLSFPLL